MSLRIFPCMPENCRLEPAGAGRIYDQFCQFVCFERAKPAHCVNEANSLNVNTLMSGGVSSGRKSISLEATARQRQPRPRARAHQCNGRAGRTRWPAGANTR